MSLLSRLPVALSLLLILAGCATPATSTGGDGPASNNNTPGIQGRVTAQAQGVANATLNLYAVGTAGDGTPATSLLKTAVIADNAGNFDLLNKFTCPSQTTQVVLVATGGNPGGSANPNSALALLLAVGQCSQLTVGNYFLVNETNTVAAVAALAPFITSSSSIASSGADAAALVAGMVTARQFANVGNGISPGDAPPSGEAVPSRLINTLAGVIGTCTSSSGGIAGDGSRCGNLFQLATPPAGTPPTNTLTALLNIAANPTLNTASLFSLAPSNSSFQPAAFTAPSDFRIQMIQPTAPTLTPAAGLTFPSTIRGSSSASKSITLANTSSAAITITSSTILGASAADFSLTSTCNTTLAPQATCTLNLTFRPTVIGATSAYILLSTGSNDGQLIPLSGSAN